MGDMAQMISDGVVCDQCMTIFMDHQTPGYPRRCTGCGGDAWAAQPASALRGGKRQQMAAEACRAVVDGNRVVIQCATEAEAKLCFAACKTTLIRLLGKDAVS